MSLSFDACSGMTSSLCTSSLKRDAGLVFPRTIIPNMLKRSIVLIIETEELDVLSTLSDHICIVLSCQVESLQLKRRLKTGQVGPASTSPHSRLKHQNV
jgi:hypothetical protein